jgi:lambda family phage portal protein
MKNPIDAIYEYVAPVKAAERMRSRHVIAMMGGYDGASKSRKAGRAWSSSDGSADADLMPDLADLRDRSRDLVRNNPLACGAVNTAVTNVIGTGMRLQSQIDRDFLGLSDDEADAWDTITEREFSLWADSPECDAARTLRFTSHQEQAFYSVLVSGDAFYLMPFVKRKGSPYSLRLQAVETDRLTNKGGQADSDSMAGGVTVDRYGAPVSYSILKSHPGGYSKTQDWHDIPAYGAQSGRKNVIHLFDQRRPGQRRGVPYLAPVMESLKQLGRYTEAELMSAVVSGMFTVFVKTEAGGLGLDLPNGETNDSSKPDDYELGNGSVVGLGENESIEFANPGRPNSEFDPFTVSILRQIGSALEIPYEILIKNFGTSYSASRAAFLEAWKFFKKRRKWMADNFCQPIYEEWMTEAVMLGRISAPGFLQDPAIRKAYLRASWHGPAPGHIDEGKAVKAAKERIEAGLSTQARESVELNGSDWAENVRQRSKEIKLSASMSGGGVSADVNTGESDPFAEFKQKAEAYGVAVRAGAITPQTDDEDDFRDDGGLPEMSKEVKDAWANDGGVRRPITLQSGQAYDAEQERIEEDGS